MKREPKEFGVIFWIHLSLIVLFYALPVLVDWRLVLLSVILYYLQKLVFHACPLTTAQFPSFSKHDSFYHHYLT